MIPILSQTYTEFNMTTTVTTVLVEFLQLILFYMYIVQIVFVLFNFKTFNYELNMFRCAFFHGQIEQPVRGLMSLINHKDVPIYIAVNTEGVYILDCVENVIYFKFKYL